MQIFDLLIPVILMSYIDTILVIPAPYQVRGKLQQESSKRSFSGFPLSRE